MFQTTNQMLDQITRKKHVDPGLLCLFWAPNTILACEAGRTCQLEDFWMWIEESLGIPIRVCLKIVYPIYPMVLLIIIPMKNGYFIGKINPTFSDKPIRSPIDGILEAIGGSMQTSGDPRMNESSAYYEWVVAQVHKWCPVWGASCPPRYHASHKNRDIPRQTCCWLKRQLEQSYEPVSNSKESPAPNWGPRRCRAVGNNVGWVPSCSGPDMELAGYAAPALA